MQLVFHTSTALSKPFRGKDFVPTCCGGRWGFARRSQPGGAGARAEAEAGAVCSDPTKAREQWAEPSLGCGGGCGGVSSLSEHI